jgi:murein DD-endopeptidase MepM/ murein hydrolase activator NlpD
VTRFLVNHFRVRCVLCIALVFVVTSCSSFSNVFTEGEEFDYKVAQGDSLFSLAKRFKVSVVELQKINKINDPRGLRIGQVLKVPVRDGVRKETASGGPYVSAEQARKQRENVRLPALNALGVRLSMPMMNPKFGSRFGFRGSRFHEGWDLLAPIGTPIYAAHDGVVVFSGQKLSGYGNLIALKSGSLMTLYAHNSKNLVRKGDRVKSGDKIAEVGATGRATGPHLHFELRVRGSDGRYYAVEPFTGSPFGS